MTGFASLTDHSPLLTAIVGALFFFGMLGTRQLLCRNSRLPSPWDNVISLVLSTMCYSTICQLLAFAHCATRPALITLLFLWVAPGLTSVSAALFNSRRRKPHCSSRYSLPAVIAAVLLFITAMSGSTKIDELYYHMLTPSRIVMDGGLEFYRYPWQSAVQQMAFQIALSPLHALGFPHAGNVFSTLTAGLLTVSSVRLLMQHQSSDKQSGLLAACLLVGAYPAVWYVTGGGHAFGDLAMTFGILACILPPTSLEKMHRGSWHFAVATLLTAAACTKLSVLPLASVTWLLHLTRSTRRADRGTAAVSTAWALLPWLVFWAPLPVWTWFASGSPFGPFLSGWFGDSVYNTTEIAEHLQRTRQNGQTLSLRAVASISLAYSPVFWTFLFSTFREGFRQSVAVALLLFQFLLTIFFLPWAVRFLAGAHIATVVSTTCRHTARQVGVPRPTEQRSKPALWLLLSVFLCGQAIYCWPFVAYVAGVVTAEEHHHLYTPFYNDLLKLDYILPENATILVAGVRANAVCFPRRVLVHPSDITDRDSRIYLFACRRFVSAPDDALPQDLQAGRVVHQNKSALISASRIPFVRGTYGPLKVFQVHRAEGTVSGHWYPESPEADSKLQLTPLGQNQQDGLHCVHPAARQNPAGIAADHL